MTADVATVRWQMAEPMRRLLLRPAGLPLADWLGDGTATVIKDGPHRAVYRVRLPHLDCHVKHYRVLGWRSRVRQLIRPVKAMREATIANDLAARGIPTPEALAWGVESAGLGPRASWLITKTVGDSIPLNSYLESILPTLSPKLQTRTRQRLARAVGRFLTRLHAAGLIHHDLHPGNLLVRMTADGEPMLWLIDLHAVRLGPACRWPARRENLVVFNRYFQLRASRSDRLRFWRSYAAAAGDAIPEPARFTVTRLESDTERSNLRLWRKRDARCRRSNRYYRRINSDAVRGFAVRNLDPSALAALTADPDAAFERPGVRVLKSSRSSTVVELDLTAGGASRPVVYKRFRVTDRRDPWLGLVRRSGALRSWVYGHGLRERRLPTPRPLAVFHRTRRGLPHEAYLLTEKVENAVDVREFLRRMIGNDPEQSREGAKQSGGIRCEFATSCEIRARAAALARLLCQMHQRGLSHRDLKASNLLTSTALGDARFWFIDLVGVRRHDRIGRRRKVRDLMRLHVSLLSHPLITRTERLRFLKTYLQAGLTGAAGWKDRWRAIAAAAEAKVQQNLRSGRPLG
jgi:tRNA A-37 threonylcarbamoyl transferase component Bud32